MPLKPEMTPPERVSYKALTDEELALYCKKGERLAWEELFKRFTPIIKWTIKKKFISEHMFRMSNDIDIIHEIYLQLIEKIYGENEIESCRENKYIKAWVIAVTNNITTDWIRSYRRRKNLPDRVVEETMDSLNRTVGDKGSTSEVIDQLKAEETEGRRNDDNLDDIWSSMLDNNSPRSFWTLRLSIIAYEPLREDEIEELCRFNGKPMEQVRDLLSDMQETVDKKSYEKIESEEAAAGLLYEISTLENMIRKAPGNLRGELLDRLAKKRHTRQNHLDDMNKLNRPTNKQVAELVGIDPDQAGQVSNMLIRARNNLEGNRMLDEE